MKQFLSILLMLTVLASCQKQRESYLITGNLKNIPDSTVIDLYEMSEDIGSRIDSDTILNGSFNFSGTLEERPLKMMLHMRDWNNYFGSCDLWVDYENIEIAGESPYLSSWIVSSNVKNQKYLNQLKSKTRDLDITIDSLYLIRTKNRTDKQLSTEIRSKTDSINELKHKIEFDFIEKNPNNKDALKILYKIVKHDTTISQERIVKVYESLKPSYKNTLFGEGIKVALQDNEIPDKGHKMVDFTAHDTSGVEYSLSDFNGKYILLDFWSFGCGPCIMAIPEMKELNSEYNDVLSIVGVNMAANEKFWKKASKRESIPWVNLSDGKGTIAGISSLYGIQGFPTYILINPEGIIVERWMGYWKGVFEKKLTTHIESKKQD